VKNTDTGVRYLCETCAYADGREIVRRFSSIYGGRCKFCGTYIEIGQDTFVLDSGIRRERSHTRPKVTKPKPCNPHQVVTRDDGSRFCPVCGATG
jgi:hypothetical protein